MELMPEQLAEISRLQQDPHTTKRATVTALEEILYTPFPMLDHGFLRVIDYMGDDSAIVQAARVSYGRGTKKVSEDRGLINYLMRHRHTTPFEMCEIKFHVKLPIFVARQWIRHRMASVNEYSARYSILDREFYFPEPDCLAAQSTDNRQGRGKILSGAEAAEVFRLLKTDAEKCYNDYEYMINEDPLGRKVDPDRDGLARELARMNLPLNVYTQWYWKIDLHNLFHFLNLRADSHAQYEIRLYAEKILDIVRLWVPMSAAAFEEYQRGGTHISRKGMEIVRRMLKGEKVDRAETEMSKREWNELMDALGVDKEP